RLYTVRSLFSIEVLPITANQTAQLAPLLDLFQPNVASLGVANCPIPSLAGCQILSGFGLRNGSAEHYNCPIHNSRIDRYVVAIFSPSAYSHHFSVSSRDGNASVSLPNQIAEYFPVSAGWEEHTYPRSTGLGF